MKRTRIVSAGCTCFAILLFLAAASATMAGEGKAYGKPLSDAGTTKISAIMASPDEYVGKVVRVEGLITAVCEKRGCWMSLASDQEFQELRIKVDDGVIVFPIEAKGKRAIAEGELTKLPMTLDETIAFRKHEAEERKQPFDPAKVTEPMTFYQIKATGAVIL